MTSTITIVSENAAGTVTSTVPSVLPAGVTSITGSHPTYTVTYDITTRRQVIIPFTVSDGTDTITAMISVEVGYVPFFVAAGAEPTVLPTAPVEAPYGPQPVIFPNTRGEDLYLIVENSESASPTIESNGFRIVPIVTSQTLTGTDLNGDSHTYIILNLGTSTRSSQTVTILET